MKKDLLFLIFAIAVSVIVGAVSVTVAKYQWKESEDILYAPASFYFSSDLLKEENTTYTLQDNAGEISVVLKNYEDSLRVSSNDIVYQVIIKKGEETLSSQTKNGTITTAEKQETITFSGLSVGTYQVIATSSSPYQKSLSATFVIPDSAVSFQTSVSNTSATSVLTIITNDYQGNLTISFPSGLVPDNTNPLLQGATGNQVVINVAKNSSYDLTFLKTITGSTYSVSVSGTTITIS